MVPRGNIIVTTAAANRGKQVRLDREVESIVHDGIKIRNGIELRRVCEEISRQPVAG